jgi:hypothetical protein
MNNKILFSFLAVLSACSTLKVSYDYDKQGDFSHYKSYTFSEESMKLPINELNRDRILRAVENELAAKGFSKSDNPDVIIDLRVRAAEKTEAYATTTGPGYYGRRWGYAGGFSSTSINYEQYVEGTLFVSMVDAGTEKIVWQGRATNTIDEDASPQKREQNINYAVNQIFTKYPPK